MSKSVKDIKVYSITTTIEEASTESIEQQLKDEASQKIKDIENDLKEKLSKLAAK